MSGQNDRLTGLVGNSAIKVPCRAATTAAIVLSGLQTVDGVVLAADDRVLVKNQASSVDNGIYTVVTGGAWTRTKDCDGTYDLVLGSIVEITNGTVNAGLFYQCTAANPITIGTTALTWAVVSPSSPITLPLAIAQGGTGQATATAALGALNIMQLTGAGGTANVQTATGPSSEGALAANQLFEYTPAITNTGAVTLTVTPSGGAALAAKNVFYDGAACAGGELVLGVPTLLLYDGMQLNIVGHSRKIIQGAAGADGQSLLVDSSKTSGHVYIDNPARPNLLINPNWQIDQINEGALYTVNAADVRGPDGWSGTEVGAGVFKLRTLADPDNAALKCLEITCTTADAAIAAADDYFIYSAIEGYDAAALMAGTASAQPITVQFKFKSNVTGVYGISIANSALNRRYIGIITVADTSEHEYVVSLTMDTSGTWLYTNGVGLYLRLCLAAGSNFQGTAGAWAAGAEQTTSAQANFMSVNTNIAYLKRIQLIPGALVQAYRPADIQKELAKAQRYYQKSVPQGTAVAQSAGLTGALHCLQANAAGTRINFSWDFAVIQRSSTGTVTGYNPSAANNQARDIDTGTDDSALTVRDQSDRHTSLDATAVAGSAATQIHAVHITVNARLS